LQCILAANLKEELGEAGLLGQRSFSRSAAVSCAVYWLACTVLRTLSHKIRLPRNIGQAEQISATAFRLELCYVLPGLHFPWLMPA
jgi:hypothetical protein